MRLPATLGLVCQLPLRSLSTPALVRAAVLILVLLQGCAARKPPPAVADCTVASAPVPKAHPRLAARRHGDSAMRCTAIKAGIAEMNRRIIGAQHGAQQEANHAGPGGASPAGPAADAASGGGAGLSRLPVEQKAAADAARARASVLVRLGRAKRCFT